MKLLIAILASTLLSGFVTPTRVMWTQGDIRNEQKLLQPFCGQVAVNEKETCVFGEGSSVLLDFGKEIHGGIRITAARRQGKEGVRFRVRFGESVSEAMSDVAASTATNDHSMRDAEISVPWLGSVEFGNTGFRFVRLDLVQQGKEVPLVAVEAKSVMRDIPYLGSFRCSDSRLNDIWQTAAYTVHLNMQDYVWDGIKRDRLVWIGDMHPEVSTILSVFGNQEVVRRSLDFARDNTPADKWMNDICSYSLWWLIIHRDQYLYTGDLDYLKQQHSYATALLRHVISCTEGSRENYKEGRFIDWPTSRNAKSIHQCLQALTVMALQAGGEIATALSDEGLKADCEACLDRLKDYRADKPVTKQAAAFMVLAGLINPEDGAAVIEAGGANGFATFTGYYMLEALAKAGHYTAAEKLASDYWGAMLDLGATSFWEDLDYAAAKKAGRIDEFVPEGKFDIHADGGDYCYKGLRHSFAHGWASGPAPWMQRHILGVVPLEPGFSKVLVRPNLGDLEWAEGTFPTPSGIIKVFVSKEADGNITTKVEAPGGVRVVKQIESDFVDPPRAARPYVWWHWMNGNITKEGIRKDLLWMNRIGIGGFHHFDAGIGVAPIVKNRLIYMHDDWKDAFKYAIEVGDSLGMEMAVASSPGWSCMGGPWVRPADAMKKLVWREMYLKGKQRFCGALPEPFREAGLIQNVGRKDYGFYEDIAVLAVKLPAADVPLTEMGVAVSSSVGALDLEKLTNDDLTDGVVVKKDDTGFAWITYEFPSSQSIRAVSLYDGRNRSPYYHAKPSYSVSLQKSDDGKSFEEVVRIPSTSCSKTTISFPEVKAKYFRLKINDPNGKGARVSEFNLYPVGRINHAEEKACFASPHDIHDYPTTTDGEFANVVIDITDKVRDGILKWNVPKGNWKILRIGYSLTGHLNGPAPKEATGLEVDKLDPEALTTYFRTYLDMYKDASGGLIGDKGIQYMLVDSYEAGAQNWTPGMVSFFRNQRGYDLIPWLPVLTGEIVESVEKSEAFLWDWNVTIAELYAAGYNYIDGILKEYGIKGRYCEAHECGRVFVADGMDIKRHAAVPMAACWIDAGSPTMAAADIRESASVAHIYGQNLVAAESLSASGTHDNAYSYHPGKLKRTADWEMANGVNRFIIHESSHQPLDSVFPGLGLGQYGQWFNRHETWAEEARAWTDYLARSSFMLQQGRAVASILLYYGEDSNICALYGYDPPKVPAGFCFDYANPSVLKDLVASANGKIVAGNMEYEVLFLGKNVQRMSVPILKKLLDLARSGAKICGHKPLGPAGMTDDMDEWKELLDNLQSCRNVRFGVPINKVAEVCRLVPDIQYPESEDIRFVHRSVDDAEIYWINRPADSFKSVDISFRQTGRKPMMFHPETGKAEEVSYRMSADRTVVTVDFVPNDALFVVFGERTDKNVQSLPETDQKSICRVDGPWLVEFQPGRGAPQSAIFPKLISFTECDDPGIKYFSGRAIYSGVFSMASLPSGRISIDLGDVRELARVKLNGIDCGLVWKKPFCVDVTEAVVEGENHLEITVVNTWRNRLIGDEQPGSKKITYTSQKFYNKNSKTSAAGLLGPLEIINTK